jgi:GNAT superfamily N-acetyltransferase
MPVIHLSSQIHLLVIRPEDHTKHFALMARIYPPAFAYLWPDAGGWYVDRTHNQAALQADLSEPDAPYYHVYYQDELIGIFRLQLHTENPDFPDAPALKLDRVYLNDAVRGKGVGSVLIDYAKAETVRLNKRLLWLERMSTNDATISFYRKHGFVDGGEFRLPFEQMYPRFRGMFRMAWFAGAAVV